MSFLEKYRIGRSQPKVTNERQYKFAPGWLVENQRSALRMVAGALVASLALNGYQMYLREQIAAAPPEVFAALINHDFSTLKVINQKEITPSILQSTAEAEVRRLVYRLRRIDTRETVQEQINMLYCSVTGNAAATANKSFEGGQTAALIKRGHKRILHESGVNAGRRPGEAVTPGGMWISATWVEEIDDGVGRPKPVPRSAEFRVEQFPHVNTKIRNCNPLGVLITDYNILSGD